MATERIKADAVKVGDRIKAPEGAAFYEIKDVRRDGESDYPTVTLDAGWGSVSLDPSELVERQCVLSHAYAVGFRRSKGGTTRRVFGSAVEAASCYLEWAKIDGSVSTYAGDIAAGAIFEADREDGTVSVGEDVNPAYPSDDDYDEAMPHLQAAEGT